MPQTKQTLIIGGVRSGKSRYAESLLVNSPLEVVYIATAKADDDEMVKRIADHKAHRPSYWKLIEEPYALAKTLSENDSPDKIFLIECLTLWITQLLCLEDEARMNQELDDLLALLPTLQASLLFVSNEVGLGIIPLDKISRLYVDIAGKFNQEIAAKVDEVVFIIAGIPQRIKQSNNA